MTFSTLHPRDSEEVSLPNTCLPPDESAGDGTGMDGEGGMGAEEEPEPPPPSVVLGCDRRLGVDVIAENWEFRAPFACGSTVGCGYLVVELYSHDADPGADPSAPPAPKLLGRAEAALNSVLLDLADKDGDDEDGEGGASGASADRYDEAELVGIRELRATLMNADRTPFVQCSAATGCASPISTFVALDLEDCGDSDGAGGGGGNPG